MSNASITLRFADLGWPVIGPLISWVSGRWMNHVDLMVDELMLVSAMPGGVRECHYGDIRAKRVKYVTLPCTEVQCEAAVAFLRAQIGKPYDYWGTLAFPFLPPWNDPEKWFCSELAAAALHQAGIITVPFKLHRISPKRLYDLVEDQHVLSA
jgi:uncharacterized protein YycO